MISEYRTLEKVPQPEVQKGNNNIVTFLYRQSLGPLPELCHVETFIQIC